MSASCVLAINCGSSSVKVAVLEPASGHRFVTGVGEEITTGHGHLTLRRGDQVVPVAWDGSTHADAVVALLGGLTAAERDAIAAVGHRIVHGGTRFSSAVVVDDAVVEALAGLVPLAPLHLPAETAAVAATRRALPALPQVLVFDTAFHHSMPAVAARYAVPEHWYADAGVRRYGFHGISHNYVAHRVAELVGRPLHELRLVTLHLGNGASATAVRDGRSVDTTMGFSPLEGLMMGTRSGDVDPTVLGYLAARDHASLDELIDELNQHSGLAGVSGLSHDVRELTRAEEEGSTRAARALDMFCYRAAKAVGAMAVAAGGLDILVFTGGIGEHSPRVRGGVLAALGHLGLRVDSARNEAQTGVAPVTVPGPAASWVVPTDEEVVVAREVAALIPDAPERGGPAPC